MIFSKLFGAMMLGLFISQANDTVSTQEKGIYVYRNSQGWPIPHAVAELRRTTHTISGNDSPVIAITYRASSDEFRMPFAVHESSNRDRILYKLYYVDTITEFSLDSCVIAYGTLLLESGMGASSVGLWYDEDGDGRFTKFEWSTGNPSIPAWIHTDHSTTCQHIGSILLKPSSHQ